MPRATEIPVLAQGIRRLSLSAAQLPRSLWLCHSGCVSAAGWCSGWPPRCQLTPGASPLIPPTISSARVPLDSQHSVRRSSFAPVVRVRRATLKHVACGRECPAGGAANMRSGSPNTQGECRLKYPASGPVKSVQLEYRYAAGYGCGPPPDHTCENPPTMELWAQTEAGVNAGGPMYTNPKMDVKSGYAPGTALDFCPCQVWVSRYRAFLAGMRDTGKRRHTLTRSVWMPSVMRARDATSRLSSTTTTTTCNCCCRLPWRSMWSLGCVLRENRTLLPGRQHELCLSCFSTFHPSSAWRACALI